MGATNKKPYDYYIKKLYNENKLHLLDEAIESGANDDNIANTFGVTKWFVLNRKQLAHTGQMNDRDRRLQNDYYQGLSVEQLMIKYNLQRTRVLNIINFVTENQLVTSNSLF